LFYDKCGGPFNYKVRLIGHFSPLFIGPKILEKRRRNNLLNFIHFCTGHGPFSHLFDMKIIPEAWGKRKINGKWTVSHLTYFLPLIKLTM
jgi:hypothetical protein